MVKGDWTEREVLMMNRAKLAPEACIAAFVGVAVSIDLKPAPQATLEEYARERNR